jgi:hypothetical protein
MAWSLVEGGAPGKSRSRLVSRCGRVFLNGARQVRRVSQGADAGKGFAVGFGA